MGSTPSTLTSLNCSTKASIAFSSPCKWGTSASVIAIRARCAIRRTVVASTDIYRASGGEFSPPYSRGRFCAATTANRFYGPEPGQLPGHHPKTQLVDDLVRGGQQLRRYRNPQFTRGFEVDRHPKLGRLFYRKFGWPRPL